MVEITDIQLKAFEECLEENKKMIQELNELRGYIKYLEAEREQ